MDWPLRRDGTAPVVHLQVGLEADPMAVVDPSMKVHGTEGLRVSMRR